MPQQLLPVMDASLGEFRKMTNLRRFWIGAPDRQVPRPASGGMGGVKGAQLKDISLAHILFATACPGSPSTCSGPRALSNGPGVLVPS